MTLKLSLVSFACGIAFASVMYSICLKINRKHLKGAQEKKLKRKRSDRPLSCYIHPDITSLVGNTPIMELKSLSKATGCTILVPSFIFYC